MNMQKIGPKLMMLIGIILFLVGVILNYWADDQPNLLYGISFLFVIAAMVIIIGSLAFQRLNIYSDAPKNFSEGYFEKDKEQKD
jgi:Na+/melibiose symporter-like transporter